VHLADTPTPAQASEWRSAMGFPTDNLLREARCANLIMMQASSRWESIYREINVGASILGTGRPVLVVASGAKPIRAAHVVMGWKDTRGHGALSSMRCPSCMKQNVSQSCKSAKKTRMQTSTLV
jgi:hypothetical protein